MNACLLLLFGLGALFDVKPIPVESPTARAFFAQVDEDAPAGLFILNGLDMAIYSAESDTARRVAFHAGTTVFDVADITGDGHSEIVAVENNHIMRYAIPLQGDAPEPAELFTLDTLLEGPTPSPQPQPFVLALVQNGETLLVLPTQTDYELRRPDGSLVSSYPYDGTDKGQAPSSSSFYAMSLGNSASWAPPGSLRLHVSSGYFPETNLPSELRRFEAAEPESRRAASSQLTDMADQKPENWPWFNLFTKGGDSPRVLYAPAKPDLNNTVVRIREVSTTVNPWSESGIRILPARQYPGILAMPYNSLPDFNGDGYVDLFLWQTPKPGRSFDSLLRAAIGKTWPVRVSAHLFNFEKMRYEPAAAASIECRLPIYWFLKLESGAPMRNCVLEDFNGDGKTDAGWSTSPEDLNVWLYRDSGFAPDPDFTCTFPEPIEGILERGDISGKNRMSLLMRGAKNLYWLCPSQTPGQPESTK